MNETAFELVSLYGVYLVFLATFLSCLALPIPSSFVMLAGGAFVASGDMALVPTSLAAFIGAVLGDAGGFLIGRHAGPAVIDRFRLHAARAKVWAQTEAFMDRWGGWSVFLSRSVFSPLGPYVNLISGTTGLPWARFLPPMLAGEAIWVGTYVGLGWLFSGSILKIADILGSAVAALAGIAAAVALGTALWRAAKR